MRVSTVCLIYCGATTTVKRTTGVVIGASNLPSWTNVPLAGLIKEKTKRPVRVDLTLPGFLCDEAFSFSPLLRAMVVGAVKGDETNPFYSLFFSEICI